MMSKRQIELAENHSNKHWSLQIAVAETLEGRVLLSQDEPWHLNGTLTGVGADEIPGGTWDAGDYYWSSGQKYPLLRASDEMVVGFRKGQNASRLVKTLTAAD